MDFAVPADHRVKMKEREKISKFLDLVRKLKKLLNMTVTVIPIIVGTLGTVIKVTEGIGNQKKNRDPIDHSIVKIG